ncbi:MAG: tRNA 2-thiocytidine(32) synthetase TtcA [Firmicutes bacterium]|nr:tRNA 2-thiocytidine(32) synthetase TtcA [Bacillota bacterium]
MTFQQLMGYTRRAIDDYQMISEGDKIAIGVSGGKDSLALAVALKGLQAYYPKHFEIAAFTVSLGFPEFDTSGIEEFMAAQGIPYTVIQTNIAHIVFEERKEQNPCSLCSKLRKGALNRFAAENHCNKVALGHHNEDVVETFYMSLFYEGRLHTFAPVTQWDRTGLVAIRPLLYVHEGDIVSYARLNSFPVLKNPCPEDGHSNRESMKEQIRAWNHQYDHITDKTFRALQDELSEWKIIRKERRS